MAATNVQAFSGDVEVASNLAVNTNTLFVDAVGGTVGIGSTRIDITDNTLSGAGNGLYIHNPVQGGHLLTLGTQRPWVFEQGLSDASTELCLRALNSGKKFNIQSPDYSNVMTIVATDGGGSVGVGTTDPKSKFHVSGSSARLAIADNTKDDCDVNGFSTAIAFVDNTWNGSTLYADNPTAGMGFYLGHVSSSNKEVNMRNLTGELSFGTRDSGARAMYIDNDGDIGIGTDSPASKLDVNGEIRGAYNLDTTSYFGRAAVGYCGFSDYMAVSHIDSNDGAGYALLQYSDGTTFLNSASGMDICFREANADKMRLKNGKLGIGTVSPSAKLHVVGGAGVFGTLNPDNGVNEGKASYMLAISSTIWTNTTGNFGNISIYGSDDILSGKYIGSLSGYITASDSRIKKEIVDVEDGSALETLRLLKPKQYKYKDVINRGSEPVWGFIAQEVRDTLPYATQTRRECLPNIYETANVSDSNVITFTNFNTSNLESNAMVLKVFDTDDTEHLVNITEVVDDHSVRVEEDLSKWTGSVDESGNVVAGNQLFVYGQRVDDFVFLKKDSIWTIATSALQEVDRQLQAEKTKVASLEARISALENN